MNEAKYNVLMMRDNSPVRRYRLSPMWLKVVASLLLILCAAAGGGGYAGITFWMENTALREEYAMTQRALRDARIELERLQNIDSILKANDPEELQTLLGTVSSSDKPQVKPAKPPVDLRKLFKRVDLQQVGVDNLQAKVKGGKIKVTFNLNNLVSSGSITGRAHISLLTSDGVELHPETSEDDLSFQIQRFKQIVTSFDLPKNAPMSKVFGLKLAIKNTSGQTLFSETYPLSYIRS